MLRTHNRLDVESWQERSVAIYRALAWPAAAGGLSVLVDANSYYQAGDTTATILVLFEGMLGLGVFVAVAGPWRSNVTFRNGVCFTWYMALFPMQLLLHLLMHLFVEADNMMGSSTASQAWTNRVCIAQPIILTLLCLLFIEHPAVHILLVLGSALTSSFIAGDGYELSIGLVMVGSILARVANDAYFTARLDADTAQNHLSALRRWTLRVGHDIGTNLQIVESYLPLLLATSGNPVDSEVPAAKNASAQYRAIMCAIANMMSHRRMSVVEHRVMSRVGLQPEQASCRTEDVVQRIKEMHGHGNNICVLVRVIGTVAPVIITDPCWLAGMATRLIFNAIINTPKAKSRLSCFYHSVKKIPHLAHQCFVLPFTTMAPESHRA